MSTILQKLYEPVYQLFGGNELLISAIGGLWCVSGWFWMVNAILLYVDITGKPSWLRKYKVQPEQNTPIDTVKLKKTIRGVLYCNFILNGVCMLPIYLVQKQAGCSFAVDEVPGYLQILRDLVVSIIIQEIIFFYSHWLMHHPAIYKTVHKKHHEWTSPIGVVAIYSTATEYLTGSIFSILAGPLLMKSHIVTIFIWFSLADITTVIHHSGYHFPLLPSPEFHDYHHLTYNYNYGTLGVLDWLHGTDKQFRKTVQNKRHRTLWSLTPIHEKIKDLKSKR